MAGHSKWANIKHRKGRQDEKKQKIFSKFIRELTVASRLGGPIAADNPRLRLALDKALGANMPKDTIDRAIARGAGNSEADNLEEIKYEGYGPNGVAILIDAMTDNRNRTVAEVRHAFTKAGGSLGTDGSVAYQFESKGIISISGLSEDDTLELVIDYDIEEIESRGEIVTVICKPDNFLNIKEILEQSNAGIENAEITMLPSNSVELGDEDSEKVIRLIDTLEDLDDVQNVYTNAELSEASVT